ncbi:MAG: hypothetical protein ABI288_07070 [Ginsengibacter sp.]
MRVDISKTKALQNIDLSTTKELQKIGLSAIQIEKFQKLKATPRPMSAKITNMGFDPKLISTLPKNVQTLTKADLIALGGWSPSKKLSPAAAKISVTEIQQIRDVFGKGIAGSAGNLAMDIYCCCCPCCCAATVTTPVSIKKEKTLRA